MLLGRPRRRWEDNIRIDPVRNRMGRCGLDLSGLGTVAEVSGSCEHDNESTGSIKGGEFLEELSDS
jgi:hypothetical protein